jgi:hypothetical protein
MRVRSLPTLWRQEEAGCSLHPSASSYTDGDFVMERKVRRSKNIIALCKPSNKFISYPALVAWSSGQNLFGPTKQKVYNFVAQQFACLLSLLERGRRRRRMPCK